MPEKTIESRIQKLENKLLLIVRDAEENNEFKKDVRETLKSIDNKLSELFIHLTENYLTKVDFEKKLTNALESVRLEIKNNTDDIEKINVIVRNVTWLIVSTVILATLGLIIIQT